MSTPAQSKPANKARYRVTNWPKYDQSLVNRGSLTIWFDEKAVRENWCPAPTGGRGAPLEYSDMAIQTLLTLKAVFHLSYRALEGFARSLVGLMGLDLKIPDHSHLSRRAATVQVQIPRKVRTQPIKLLVDSTGLKVAGEGEWKVRQHGVDKRRRWIKVHLALDADEKDVIGVEVTTAEWADCEVFEGLVEQVPEPIEEMDADGAYDTRQVYARAQARGAKLNVPPRENAVPWEPGHPRTQVLEQVAQQGMAAWKEASGYHRRSLVENAMYRLKQLFGSHLASKAFDAQVAEVHVRLAAMNRMTYLGMPVSVRVGESLS